MRAVLERDFLAQVTRGRAVLMRTLLAAVVGGAMLVLILGSAWSWENAQDRLAREIFLVGAFFLLGGICLLAPAHAVGAVLEERIRETLPLVLASPVGPRGLAVAKFLARVASVHVLAAAALPTLALTTVLGGVSGRDLVDLGTLLFGVVVETTAWALYVSCRTRRYATAVVLAYLAPALRWVICGAVGVFLGLRAMERGEEPVAGLWLAESTPVAAAFLLTQPTGLATFSSSVPGTFPTLLLAWPAQLFAATALLVAALAVAGSARLLEREAEPASSWLLRWRRGRRWFRRPPPDHGNPVAWKERLLLDAAASRVLYYVVLAVCGLGEGAFLAWLWVERVNLSGGSAPADLAIGFFIGMAVLIALAAGAHGAITVVHEKARGSFDLLRVSPLGAARILDGKRRGILVGVAFLALLPACHLLLCAAVGLVSWFLVAGLLASGTLMVLFWLALGLRCSLGAPAVRTAVTRYALLVAVLGIGGPVTFGLADEVFRIPWNQEAGVMALLMGGCPPLHLMATTDWLLRAEGRPWNSSVVSDGLGWIWGWTGIMIVVVINARHALLPRLAAELEDRGEEFP